MNEISQQVILFDGICNFCNFWVNYIIDRDKQNVFKFAALQSATGRNLLSAFNLDTTNFDTFILVDSKKYYTKSTAVLKIANKLSYPTKIIYLFIIIPEPVRDLLYLLIASNRYKFFGKRDICRIPTEEEKSKFLS